MTPGSTEDEGESAAVAADLPFRELAQHLAAMCWISDAEGRIVWVNDAWLAYTGYDVPRIEAEGLKPLHDPAIHADVLRRWAEVRASEAPGEMTFPLRGRDGTLRPFHTRVVPVRDERGDLSRWFGVNTDVSAQAATEARLRTSEEQWRQVFECAGDGVFITDAEGRLVDVNAEGCAMAQRSRDELLGMSVWELIVRDEHADLAAARAAESSDRDWRVKRKDGTLLLAEISSRRLSDGRRIGVARDVSARRLAEEAERAALTARLDAQTVRASDAERQLQRFWDASNDLFAIVSNLDGKPRLINARAWEATLGFPAETVLGTRMMDLVHPDDRARTLEMRQAALNENAYYGFENRYLTQDGRVVWLSWNVVREDDLIYCSARDITGRKRSQEALARSERDFRMLVAGVVDYALIMLTPEGVVARWNAGAERIKGYTAEEIVGRPFSGFYTEADREAGLPERALATAREQGRYEAEGWRVRKDGSLFWANAVLDAIRDEDGTLIGFAKITRDITERRQAQIELDHANDRLAQAQKIEALGLLTGGVAHDFNNLLMVVSGQAELLRKRVDGDERASRQLDAIATAAARGQQLTSRLLAFARRQRLTPKPVALNARAGELEMFLLTSLGAGVELIIDFAPDLWTVEIDVNAWEVAVLNMAVNARDAMPNGGRLTISARNVAAEAGDVVELTVADTGVGIPADVLPRVVDPFFTTKDVSKGTGLGLSQVDGFVQQSGGQMTIESELGVGTTIRIALPRAAAAAAAGEAPSRPREAVGLEVLCVEDNVDVADVAASMLETLGHHVQLANSADAALKLIDEGARPDVVLTDIVMAGETNGLGLARRLRQARPALPIVLVTGYSREAEAIGDEFPVLAKPYQLADLGVALQSAVDRRARS